MAADPYGAALTTPKDLAFFPNISCVPVLITGWEGKNGAKWDFTPIGPTPVIMKMETGKKWFKYLVLIF